MRSSKTKLYKMILSAMFLAIAYILPFFTGQIPQIGNALCPMHLPVLLCGFFCGPMYGLAVGAAAPLLRSGFLGIPPFMPKGIGMAFELATYGFVVGLLYKKLPKTKANIYVSLIGAMIAGRIVWGVVRVILLGVAKAEFSWTMFISGALLTAIPGIIIQIVLIPILVMALSKYTNK